MFQLQRGKNIRLKSQLHPYTTIILRRLDRATSVLLQVKSDYVENRLSKESKLNQAVLSCF